MRVCRQVFSERILRVAGNEDEFYVRLPLAQFAKQRRPIHLGHHHIGNDNVDLAAERLEDFQRLDA